MQKKFILIISLLTLSIVIFTIYNVNELYEEISDNQYNKLINELTDVSYEFNTWISDKEKILVTAKDIVDNFSYEEITRSSTLNELLNINNNDPNISQIYIGLSTGEFITGGQWVPPDDYDPRTRTWYKEAVTSDSTIISSVYIDMETEELMVTISSPLYLGSRFIGVISADVFLDNINAYLMEQLPSSTVYSFIIDSEGRVIVHTKEPDWVGLNLYTDIGNDDLVKYAEEAKSTKDIVRMEYDIQGQDIRGTMQKVGKVDWYISVASVENKNIIMFRNIEKLSLFFNVLTFSIIFVLLFLVIRIKLELDKKNEALKSDNERDFLTGIYNRRYFNLKMDTLWKADVKSKISLLMMDVDYFKGYNDNYGHIEGDEVLKEMTSLISSLMGKEDVFSRYGGEEFTIILKDVSAIEASKIASKIIKTVFDANIENLSSPNKRLTVSIGVASLVPSKDVSIQYFINMADAALYRAKENGRNMFVISDDVKNDR